EPLLSILQIKNNSYNNINDKSIAVQSIGKARHKNIEIVEIILKSITSNLKNVNGKYLYFALDNCHVDESFFSFSIDLLEKTENSLLDGILSGAWLDKYTFDLKEIFTKKYYDKVLPDLREKNKDQSKLADNQFQLLTAKSLLENHFQLLSMFLFKTSSFKKYINNFENDNFINGIDPFDNLFQLTQKENSFFNIYNIYTPLITLYLSKNTTINSDKDDKDDKDDKNDKNDKNDNLKQAGIINYKNDNYSIAYKNFHEAYHEDSTDYSLIIWMAAVCCDTDQHKKAIGYIQEYIKNKQPDICSLSLLALIAKKYNNSNAFYENYEFARSIIPNHPYLSKIILFTSDTKASEVMFSFL
ncbi:hypothetical protein MHK_006839, partial [Candidatus Magnetomorum sp. HK-1]